MQATAADDFIGFRLSARESQEGLGHNAKFSQMIEMNAIIPMPVGVRIALAADNSFKTHK